MSRLVEMQLGWVMCAAGRTLAEATVEEEEVEAVEGMLRAPCCASQLGEEPWEVLVMHACPTRFVVAALEWTSVHWAPLVWAAAETVVMRLLQRHQAVLAVPGALFPRAVEEGRAAMRREGRASRTRYCCCRQQRLLAMVMLPTRARHPDCTFRSRWRRRGYPSRASRARCYSSGSAMRGCAGGRLVGNIQVSKGEALRGAVMIRIRTCVDEPLEVTGWGRPWRRLG